MLGPGSGTIWRCGLVGVGVSLWQPLDEDVELSALPAPCLPRCCHAPTLMIMD
ncbi:hypothetical protein T4D_11520 [Trichinella pseudospiralis]|uniref:Uncharacterized protein n=1 Tax=Trichinella pseudospiralis TaxID=6337 RepID=A0A0V1DPE4_TRIPS|nr:hypothetical protein T4D_11520 [Trichinella pseudospiralis]